MEILSAVAGWFIGSCILTAVFITLGLLWGVTRKLIIPKLIPVIVLLFSSTFLIQLVSTLAGTGL